MSDGVTEIPPTPATDPIRRVNDLRREGTDGFSVSWFPICAATEVSAGSILTKKFLDGEVIVWRDASGTSHVQTAYCVHFGSHLGGGVIANDRVVCPLHRWEYDCAGQCVKTGMGDPVPPGARIFSFPTAERFGMIWAFNGSRATWELPNFEFTDSELQFIIEPIGEWTIDPWMVCCNTFDFQHFAFLHGLKASGKGFPGIEEIQWSDHHAEYRFEGQHWNDEPIQWHMGIWGTTVYFQEGLFDGKWFGLLAPLGIERPGYTTGWYICATRPEDNSVRGQREARAWGRWALDMEQRFALQDVPIFLKSHFRPGMFTKSDRALGKFIEYLRAFPRAHPAKDFLR